MRESSKISKDFQQVKSNLLLRFLEIEIAKIFASRKTLFCVHLANARDVREGLQSLQCKIEKHLLLVSKSVAPEPSNIKIKRKNSLLHTLFLLNMEEKVLLHT